MSLAVPDGARVISSVMAFARAKRLDLEIVPDDAQIDLAEEGIDVAFRMGRLMDSTLTARVSHDANAPRRGHASLLPSSGTPSTPSEPSKQAVVHLQGEGSV